ncbi:hypothetical protein RUM43_007929 [Polyplax serrata]|uniref:Uncharacterized protein n=1 Tax=Polyplax serrata TaxID=468196 RepID=A0AAN8PE24_POLSC
MNEPFGSSCGKKRSDESMANLVDINPEPAMDDLSKQILSEAKLWEALQIARAELERRHQGRQNVLPMDMPLGAAISNFRRKRSPVKTNEINLLQAINSLQDVIYNICSNFEVKGTLKAGSDKQKPNICPPPLYLFLDVVFEASHSGRPR